MKTGKHVIFLGAGASCESGYPLANRLRLLTSSRKIWEKALLDYGEKQNANKDSLKTLGFQIRDIGLPFWDKQTEALSLFRNGGFATLDEFCKLAGEEFQKEIHALRRLVRGALGLFNPEEHFETSEYYGFVQALFKEDLMSLREDITVLTYNYDPFLEFLLHRALEHRWRMTQSRELSNRPNIRCAVTGGFADSGNLSWLEDDKPAPTFCVLKLHGSICHKVDIVAGYETLFSDDPLKRAQKLFEGLADSDTPPMLFPWEIMTEQGFVKNDSILFKSFGGNLGTLFQGIWQRARREVQAADKISFVGLSMHPFLFDGLKYLFEGKKGRVEVCLANPENTTFVHGRSETHWNSLPSSPAYKLAEILRKAAQGMGWSGYALPKRRDDGDMTLISDFKTFIRTQMAPIYLKQEG